MITPDPKDKPAATDEEIQAFFNGSVPLCGVCLGVSASWEGHDSNPPCRQTVANRIKARVEQDREKIATLEAQVKRCHGIMQDMVSNMEVDESFDCEKELSGEFCPGACTTECDERAAALEARIKELESR